MKIPRSESPQRQKFPLQPWTTAGADLDFKEEEEEEEPKVDFSTTKRWRNSGDKEMLHKFDTSHQKHVLLVKHAPRRNLFLKILFQVGWNLNFDSFFQDFLAIKRIFGAP